MQFFFLPTSAQIMARLVFFVMNPFLCVLAPNSMRLPSRSGLSQDPGVFPVQFQLFLSKIGFFFSDYSSVFFLVFLFPKMAGPLEG